MDLRTLELSLRVLSLRQRIEKQLRCGREIASFERGCGNRIQIGLTLADTLALVIGEEKRLRIFSLRIHGPAREDAELVHPKFGDWLGRAVEKVLGVQDRVADEFVDPTMIGFPAALISKIDGPAAAPAELCAGDRLFHAEFLDRIYDR